MNKKVLQKSTCVLLAVCMLMSIFTVGFTASAENKNSVAQAMNFPSPVFKDSPEYSYEIPTPNVNIGVSEFEKYTPNMSESVGANAPIISGVTAIAGPNDSVSIQGEGFEGGTVWVYGLDKEGNGMFTVCETTFINDTTVNAIINEKYRFGMFLFWVESASGVLSRPIRVNAPEITWTSVDAASQGTKFYLYGKNLTKNNVDGDSNVYFTNGTKSYKAQINDINAYRIEVTVPESIADGDYKLWVHNGHGGAYGWSNGLSIKVQNGVHNIWTGKTITVSNVAELKNAINNAADRDTIFLKNGTYLIDNQVSSYNAALPVLKELRFVGESKENVKIISSIRSASNPNMFATNGNCFAVLAYPSEFRNISFEDNVADYNRYGIENVRSVFVKAWGYHAIHTFHGDAGYFKVENCSFKVNRLNHGKSSYYAPSIDTMLKQRYQYYGGYSELNDMYPPLLVDKVENTQIIGCDFEAVVPIRVDGCGKAIVQNNTGKGTWIQFGNSSSAFAYFFNTKHIDVSRNQIYGKDFYTDPNGKLERYDQGFGRVIVIQNAQESTDDSYLADNDIRRNGEFDANSGEVFLYECLSIDYYDKINSVSSDKRTITLKNHVWNRIGSNYTTVDGKNVIGATIMVVGGKGEAQYRRIVGVTATNNVVVDRPFDVSLATESATNPSLVVISRVEENSVIFRNYVEGPYDFNDNYNSTAGVQAYASMLDYIGTENYFTQLHTGFYCDTHYNTDVTAHEFFNVFMDTIIYNNTIERVRDGVDVHFNLEGFPYGGARDILSASNPVKTTHSIMVRNNRIDNCVFSENWINDSNGVPYDMMLDRGATCVSVGQLTRMFNKQGTNGFWHGDWLYGTIVEHNKISNAEKALVHLKNAQGTTVLRNNYAEGKGDEEDVVYYEPIRAAGYPEVNRAIIYNNYGNETEGIYGTASNLESFDKLQNGNFAEGLKYWASNSGKGYAADNATVVDGAVKVSSRVGITSVDFKPQNVPANSKVAVVYDHKGSDKVRVELNGYGLQTVSREKLITFTNSDVKSGFNRTINNYTLTTTEDLDLNVVIYSLDGTSAEIDNIQFVIVNEEAGYYETADGIRYNLLDGSVYGGTADKGITPKNTDDIYKYGYTEGLANASFDEGFKFWQKSGTATSTISANGGKLVFNSTTRHNGVISAPFKVKNGNYGNDANRVSILIDYVTLSTTGSFYNVYLYETVNGLRTRYVLTLTQGIAVAGTRGLSGAFFADVSWKENATYNIEITSNRNTFKSEINEIRLARYDATSLVYTDILSGELYKYNSSLKKLENVANIAHGGVTTEFKNGDFESGSDYWYGSSTAALGVLTANGIVTSSKFMVNVATGTQIAVMFNYQNSPNIDLVLSANDSEVLRKSVWGSGTTLTNSFYHTASNIYKITLSAGGTYDNIRIVTVNSDGTYTDIVTGELFAKDLGPLGGTERDGYYSENKNIGTPINEPKNLDFSEGFKYWTSKHDRTGTASSQAVYNGDGTVTITPTADYDGITSINFKLPNAKKGRKFFITFEGLGSVQADLKILRSVNPTAFVHYTPDEHRWVTARSETLEITDVNEYYSLEFQVVSKFTSATFRNIQITYLDDGGLGLLMSLSGKPLDAEYGDANADGRIDLADLVVMKKYAADRSKKIYVAAANVDRDINVSVTATDISYMQNYVLTGVKEF